MSSPPPQSNTACENETFTAAELLWTVRRDVSGVNFTLMDATELFHYGSYVKLSGLLPGQSNMATAHKAAELFLY